MVGAGKLAHDQRLPVHRGLDAVGRHVEIRGEFSFRHARVGEEHFLGMCKPHPRSHGGCCLFRDHISRRFVAAEPKENAVTHCAFRGQLREPHLHNEFGLNPLRAFCRFAWDRERVMVTIGDVVISHNNVVIEAGDPPGFTPIGTEQVNSTKLDALVDALAGTASALPLLQFTAQRLWEARDRERRAPRALRQRIRAAGAEGDDRRRRSGGTRDRREHQRDRPRAETEHRGDRSVHGGSARRVQRQLGPQGW